MEPAARQRLDALGAELAGDPDSHALGPNLIDYLRHAPTIDLRGIRPVALAKLWSAPPDHAVELFLAAARKGVVAMGWELLCPRCRGAKSRVSRLQDLAKGAHCSSCNIDYERNFSRNVELTFHPEPWIRPPLDGELCMLGPGSARHIKFQGEVAARRPRPLIWRWRPGHTAFAPSRPATKLIATSAPTASIPTLVARGSDILLEEASGKNKLAIRNESDKPLVFVVEDRNWASDALTGERVIAMPAFRRLAPEQLLRPGDNAEIGWIAIMFTDLKGSTALYDALGDAPAYNLVRDHFSFLSDRVQRNHGFVVKTVGDAVMAAFSRPDHGVRAALAIQDDVASFNAARGDGATPIVLKLGLHAGPCIAVTTGDVLDYFGATVNVAARLENQCRGGEVIVSEAVAREAETAAALADRTRIEETAMLRGVSAPVRFVRITGRPRKLRRRDQEVAPSPRARHRSKRRREGLRRCFRLRLPFLRPAPRQHGADHELHLVEEHGRQEDHAEVRAGEQHARHRHAGREALLRSAEDDGDRVLAVEAQASWRRSGWRRA